MANASLRNAKQNKNDEFYTQLSDIEKELKHYKHYFRGKTVYCNADDPFESNFFKYFAMQFNILGLKKLIATSYVSSPIIGDQVSISDMQGIAESDRGAPIKIEITEVRDYTGDGSVNIFDVEHLLLHDGNVATALAGDGDFRSEECLALMREADVVVTNPPFSLFREFMHALVSNNKQFLIIGNMNALTYKAIFALIKEDRVWLGYRSGAMSFRSPVGGARERGGSDYELRKFGNICWFTNLDITKRHVDLLMYRKYDPLLYTRYYNYDAINIDKVSDIPEDYDGVMGVPVTFLSKYNPEQFEVIGLGIAGSGTEIGVRPYTVEHREYRRDVQKRGAVDGDLYMVSEEVVVVPYARVLIRRKGESSAS